MEGKETCFATTCIKIFTVLPASLSMSSFMVCSLSTVCLILWNRDRDQLMAPATGGWVLEIGGWDLPSSNRILMLSTSFSNVERISLNFFIMVELIASLARMFLKLWSMSNAPSAERRLWKDWSMKLLASSSISLTSLWKRDMTVFHSSL